MDEVTNKWRQFLSEGRPASYQIYCDMDGVLVDLLNGIAEAIGFKDLEPNIRAAAIQALESGEMWQDLIKKDKEYPELSLGTKEIFKVISHDVDFWASLPSMQDAQQLWSFLASLNPEPYILSAPWDEESRKGKILWLSGLAGNLDPMIPKDRIILTHNKHKYAMNQETGKPNILIDDMDKYTDPWMAAGGIAIKHTSAAETLRELERWLQ
tara:strand:- start:6688 stop:7320 length:633 start_codon:yes stop_codon:yes gene_type:complete